ncbi:glycoside hydrolase family 9 protein [Opitutus sp. ER46]|uniref:glycoside hydrolase family 9 protein n=1 Tax=Opitutus sp. ER46 TaxID=2161864 RepID=UPI000D31E2D2|nr:glycoside hydrolase family 9 protein [Opitutus sp. ER46]PTX96594.1 glycoside hydrolase family 9 [Opitutus sp. ER46]
MTFVRHLSTVFLSALLAAASSSLAAATHVRVNQLGYAPTASKLAVALSDAPLPAEFSVVDAASDRVAATLAARPLTPGTWGRFTYHAELDFSAFAHPGTYVLAVGESRSLPFSIAADASADLSAALLEFMRQQRCGYNPWLDTECHQEDGRTAYGPLPAGTRLDARGGWHDAGDLLKYQLTSGNATAQLLLAYLLAPESARRLDRVDARGTPQPNGVPDVLDEARWGLDWLLKLHPTPDALYHQVADDRDHMGLRLPPQDTADYGWGPGAARVVYFADGRPQGLGKFPSASTGLANLAGRYAAAMALAYQVWHDVPGERAFADRCLQAGREVYALGRCQEGVQQGNSVRAPYRYEETTWADDMEWGAAELARATGEAAFLADAKRYAALAANDTWMGREQTGHYQYYPFLNVGHFRLHGLVDPEFQRTLAGYYRTGLDACTKVAAGNPYGIGVPFIWCSNNLTVALVTQAAFYAEMTGDHSYAAFAARHADWLLGRNPWGTTMFTEVGRVFPTAVHLQTTKLTGRRVAGGLVDGPVYERIFKSLRGVTITEPDPFAAFQDARAVYHNDYQDYSTNEPTMDGTAAAVLMIAARR